MIDSSTLDITGIDQEPLRSESGASTGNLENIVNLIETREAEETSRSFAEPSDVSTSREEFNLFIADKWRTRYNLVSDVRELLISFPFNALPFMVKLLWILNRREDTELNRIGTSDRRIEERSPSSTFIASEIDLSDVVRQEVEFVFRGIEEMFEDEAEKVLNQRLSEFIRKYEGLAVNEIQHLILNEQVEPESAEAALRILGDIDHQATYEYRRWLLEKALIKCSSPIVRDGANVGLSYMDDPRSIPSLKRAIEDEINPLVRKVIRKTLVQLEDTETCLSSCKEQSTNCG